MARKQRWRHFAVIFWIPILNAQQESKTHLAIHVTPEFYVHPANELLSIQSPEFCFKKPPLNVLNEPEESRSAAVQVYRCRGSCQAICPTVQADPAAARTTDSSSFHLQTLESSLAIRTAHNSAPELATKAQLERLLAAHDLGQWTFTHEIVIDEKSIPHSHPVLTLHTRHLKQDDELLSTYLHEQLHWFLAKHDAAARAAEDDLRTLYPDVPVGYPEGANDTESTYLHLLVCRLEQQADDAVLGQQRTAEVMQFWAGDHYRWVYRTVLHDGPKIDDILERHGLARPDARLAETAP